MRRFLMVGCGGSGGATLQFVMDQLRADLRAAGIDAIPGGWQFVHVDVPTSPDGVGRGMPQTVPDQGGQYAAVASPAATYPQISAVVENRLKDRGALQEMLGWRPLPEKVDVPITTGAGQYRAVGRVLTLSKASQVRDRLVAAVAAMASVTAVQDVKAVAEAVSPSTVDQAGQDPVVLVVTSMAGGSGASMALDVCRLLATVHGVKTENVSVFAYTPEVFHRLPAGQRLGIEANATAMLGELIAAQAGASTAQDQRLLEALGLPVAGLGETPFRRMVPIGARIGGDGAYFGDGDQMSVYRGVGLGLARLMMSPVAFDSFRKACLENPVALPVHDDLFGWGVPPDRLGWGSFGYASMGMGRDRYAEYAAQRFSRAAVDRLVEGHRRFGGQGNDEQVLTRLVDETLWPQLAREADLPASRAQVREWVVRLFAGWDFQGAARDMLHQVIGARLGVVAEQEGRQWVDAFSALAAGGRSHLAERVGQTSYDRTYAWTTLTEQRLLDAVGEVVAGYGLAAASRTVQRLRVELHEVVQELGAAAAQGPPDLAQPAGAVRETLGQVKGRVAASSGQVAQLAEAHAATLISAMRAATAGLMARVLSSMSSGLAQPLADALSDNHKTLVRARAEKASVQGLAMLHTTEYQAWPSGSGLVPARFDAAQNEFPLTAVETFEAQFASHLQELDAGSTPQDSLAGLATTLLRGRWQSAGNLVATANIETRTRWRPRDLPIDPGDLTRTRRPEQVGSYRTTWLPAPLLERARDFVARPNEPFDLFVRQSLADYLDAEDVGDAERAERRTRVQRAFGQALEMSSPLVGVDANAAKILHDAELQTYHSFTPVPFNEDVNADLRKLVGAARYTPETADFFETAVTRGRQTPATTVSIFGNSPNFSPPVFRSMLEPISSRWNSLDDAVQGPFWQWRRSRPLPGSLPVGDLERQALIGGWFLGRALGLLRYPGEEHVKGFQVYDRDARTWRAFPHPLLTSDLSARDRLDNLPAVLEAMPLALALARTHPTLDPLRSYAALRRVFDSRRTVPPEVQGRWHELRNLQARALLRAWIDGAQPPGPVVPAEVFAGPSLPAGAERASSRREALARIFERQRNEMVGLLPPGAHSSTSEGRHLTLTHPSQLGSMPMVAEIAEDAVLVLDSLIVLVNEKPEQEGPVL